MDKTITRGDDHYAERPIYTVTIVDDALAPYDLANCTVRSTWRSVPIPPEGVEGGDEDDAGAALAASITLDGEGEVTASSNLILPPDGAASDGVLLLIADRSTTAGMPLASALKGDVQLTDAADRVHTVILLATLTTRDGYTSTEH